MNETTNPLSFDADRTAHFVESAVTGAPEAAKNPRPGEGENPDRATVIGQDGRWIAGWALRFIILAVACWIAWKGLGKLWTGILPILLSILVCTVLWPPVRWLVRRKVPAALAVAGTMIGCIAIIGGIFGAMAPRVADQSTLLYRQARQGVDKLQQWIENGPLDINTEQLNKLTDEVIRKVQDEASNIANGVAAGLSTATSVAVTSLMMLVLTFFFLKDGYKFLPWLRKNTGSIVGWHLSEVLSRTWNTLAGYIRAQAIVSLIDAVLIGVGLVILHVPLAFVLAVVTFFAGFIPIVGAVSAGALSVLVALVSNDVKTAVFVLILILAVQQIEGNVLSPMLQSKAMDLHPGIVLLSVTVGGGLFGIVGAFLAVPCAATIAVWLRYHAELVSLRTGELTVDDIEVHTSEDNAKGFTAQNALRRVRERFAAIPVTTHQTISTSEKASDTAHDTIDTKDGSAAAE